MPAPADKHNEQDEQEGGWAGLGVAWTGSGTGSWADMVRWDLTCVGMQLCEVCTLDGTRQADLVCTEATLH